MAPDFASDAICLVGYGADLWRRLVEHGPLQDRALSTDDRALVREFEAAGIAARSSARVLHGIPKPTLSSPQHELVYAVVARAAEALGIPVVFIKGPALYGQGLREHEHSGDVDVWCAPDDVDRLVRGLQEWGWRRQPDLWQGTSFFHSVTMEPSSWGCEVDIHRRVPGLVLEDEAAFDEVRRERESVVYAGRRIDIPSPRSHAVITALSLLRPEIGVGPPSIDVTTKAANVLGRVPLALDRAVQMGALPALRSAFGLIVTPQNLPASRGAPRDWAWRGESSRPRAYVAALREMPLRARLSLLRRLLWPSPEVVLSSARRAGDISGSVARARWNRLVRGLRLLCRNAGRSSPR